MNSEKSNLEPALSEDNFNLSRTLNSRKLRSLTLFFILACSLFLDLIHYHQADNSFSWTLKVINSWMN